jgi:hypothetical protein
VLAPATVRVVSKSTLSASPEDSASTVEPGDEVGEFVLDEHPFAVAGEQLFRGGGVCVLVIARVGSSRPMNPTNGPVGRLCKITWL